MNIFVLYVKKEVPIPHVGRDYLTWWDVNCAREKCV